MDALDWVVHLTTYVVIGGPCSRIARRSAACNARGVCQGGAGVRVGVPVSVTHHQPGGAQETPHRDLAWSTEDTHGMYGQFSNERLEKIKNLI